MSHNTADDTLIDEAAQWMAVLQSGHATAEEFSAFRQWNNADPRRAEIFKAMGASVAALENEGLLRMPRSSLLHTLNAPSGRRRFLRNALAWAGFASCAGLIARFSDSWPQPGALRTGTGERLNTTLADGSALTLDARSQVVPYFDHQQRLLQLLGGRLLIDVARDTLRPFIVETAQGKMRALGTRFMVRQDEGQTHIGMLHSHVEIITRSGTRQVISAGQQATFNADGILSLQTSAEDVSAWTQGWLEVRDRALGEVVETLRNYRQGVIRVSPVAARLRLSGMFPLDDIDRTLQLLASSLPVQIDYHSPYWISIDTRPAG